MIQIRRIDHIALPVDDVRATGAFYNDVLGLPAASPPPYTPEMAAFVGKVKALANTPAPTGGMWIEGPGSALHLIRAEQTDRRINPFGPHLAFEVEDFDEAKRSLAEHGLAFIEAPEGLPFRQLWLLDPSGNTVELWVKRERAPASATSGGG